MKRQGGFTLLEVLIASTILFAALAVASETYRSTLMASSRSQTVVEMLTPLPLITSSIRNQLRSNPVERLEGGADMMGVQFNWQAETVRYEPPPSRFDPDELDFKTYPPRFRLYDVRLELQLRGQNRVYLYQEIAWERMRR